MDIVCTQHVPATKLSFLSDRNCRVLGTMRLNNNDSHKKPAVKEAVEALKNAKCGKWLLCRVQIAPTEGTEGTILENCDYLAFKERLVAMFYSNDLADTPLLRVHDADETCN